MSLVNKLNSSSNPMLETESLVQGKEISFTKEQLRKMLIAAAPAIRAMKGPHHEAVGKLLTSK
ncbi:hypothetical protein GTU79_25705 [Sodalis ligni]|uniref:hypothetical protein n=1 Tax=Sodalis ligni TaxID=2697027 RepID=UPI001BDDEA54|nr:hypothetical protein [Sodalis ligni]QWA10552.1 hypothetical protein GTU79_25705 [Sodalis ligni]